MIRQELIALCLEYPDSYEDYPFGGEEAGGVVWTAMRHISNKKTFAFIFERDGLCINLKCEPARADMLTTMGSIRAVNQPNVRKKNFRYGRRIRIGSR